MSSTSKTSFFKGATTTRLTTKKLAGNTPTPPPPALECDATWSATIEDDPSADGNNTKSESAIMFEEMRTMHATLQRVATDIVTIKETTKELKDSVENVQMQLGEAEQRISVLEDANAQAGPKMDKCDKKVQELWSRMEELENRSRRNNIRVVGLKEGLEQPGKLGQDVEKVFWWTHSVSQGVYLKLNMFFGRWKAVIL